MGYPTIADVRALEPAVADTARYPDAVLTQRLAEAIERVEEICGRSFVPKTVTETHDVTAGECVLLDQGTTAHREGATDGVISCTLHRPRYADFTIPIGAVWISRGELHIGGGWPECCSVTVSYGTGLADCPARIKAVIATLTRLYAQGSKSATSERQARFEIADGRTTWFDQPGAYKLGLPELDAILSAWSLRVGAA